MSGTPTLPTGDQLRAIARSAQTSASDPASANELVLAGWRAALEEMCVRIKAADDAQADRDYMLDSDDCIKVIRGEWAAPLANDCPRILASGATQPSEPVIDRGADSYASDILDGYYPPSLVEATELVESLGYVYKRIDGKLKWVATHPTASKPAKEVPRDYCAEKLKPGGCQLHNLHCGYPACNATPPTGEPLTAPSEVDVIFLDAIQWGRSYGQRHNVTDETLKEVAQGYADKALAALAATAAPTESEPVLTEAQMEVLMFLRGVGDLDGCGYGDQPVAMPTTDDATGAVRQACHELMRRYPDDNTGFIRMARDAAISAIVALPQPAGGTS